MKRRVRLTESDLHKIVKESVKRILTEGETWIGDFGLQTFNGLVNSVNEHGGRCSFSLNGCDFTITPTQRGFTITSGTEFVYDSLNIESALKAAWRFSNNAF